MPIETATFVSQLDAANPSGTDDSKDGDNHIRQLKTVLQATFPNASKAFRFPVSVASKTANFNVATTEQNVLFPVNSAGGAVTATLPAGTSALDGMEVIIVKTDGSANAVVIQGTGNTISGNASISLTATAEGARLTYSHNSGIWWAQRFNATALTASLPLTGGTLTGFTRFLDTLADAVSARTTGETIAEIANNASGTPGAAVLAFHRFSSFVSFLGLDTDNTLRYGGGSLGAVTHKVFHQGQLPDTTEVTGLTAALAGKAASAHTHAQSDITGLVAALALKVEQTTSTSSTEVTFPVGQMLFVTGDNEPAMNAVVTVKQNGGAYNVQGVGTTLTGTWRVRGAAIGVTLVQRSA